MTLPSIFETCKPRPEALQGELPDSIFAADLWDVVTSRPGTHPDYADPQRFFASTYATESLKFIVKEVAERLAGMEGGIPVFRLETGFGGGKTHALIATVHVAREGNRLSEAIKDFGIRKLPEPGTVKVAAFVGDESDPVGGKVFEVDGEKIRVFTPWGQLAVLAGGKAGYELVKENDEIGVCPDRSVLQDALGEGPVLILIDELVLYMARAQALPADHRRRELTSQWATFLQVLFGLASRRPGTCAIVTLPSEQDANRRLVLELKEHLQKINTTSDESAAAAARHARSITPTQAQERAAVLGKRLFQSIDTARAQEVATAYQSYYEAQRQRGAEIDGRASSPEWIKGITAGYPFHPELMRLFAERLPEIPEFQNTRGALRLVARTIRSVWENKSKLKDTLLLQPHHIDLAKGEVRDELLARLGKAAFQRALDADVVVSGGVSHASQVDDELPWPAATQSALLCFMHSLPDGSKGLTAAEVALAIGRPGVDLDYVQKALDRTEKKGWYMRREGDHFFFRTRASVKKRFQERLADVTPTDVRETLDDWITEVYAGFQDFQIVPFPTDHTAIPDNASKLRLVLMHYDAEVGYVGGGNKLNKTRALYEKAGANETPRIYRNSLVFLLAEGNRVKGLKDAVASLLAWSRVRKDIEAEQKIMAEESGADFQAMKRKAQRGEAGVPVDFLALQSDHDDVVTEYGNQELNVRSKLLEAYRVLAFPTSSAADDGDIFAGDSISPLECFRVDFGEVPSGDGRAKRSAKASVAEGPILQCLRDNNKLVREATPDNPLVLAPGIIKKAPVWKDNEGKISTKEVWDRLRREPELPYVLREKDLLPTFKAGLTQNSDPIWFYYDQEEKRVFNRESSGALSPAVREDHFLYDPTKALEDNVLPVKTLSAVQIWEKLWPKEGGDRKTIVKASVLLELLQKSSAFPVLPDRSVLWTGLAEGVRESRWVLYLSRVELAIGPSEMDEWPGTPRFDADTEFWVYQAALDDGIYPRQKITDGGSVGEDDNPLTPQTLKEKCWPSAADRVQSEDLLRYGRGVWPSLTTSKLANLIREGLSKNLWGAWNTGDEETYYAAGDSLPASLSVTPEWTLVAPGTELASDLDGLRPGKGPQPVDFTGTPHEALNTVWEKLSQHRDVQVSSLTLTVAERDALDNTLLATWADRPQGCRTKVQLSAGGQRETDGVAEHFDLAYEGRFEEVRGILAPFWAFKRGDHTFTLALEVTLSFDPALSLDDAGLQTYKTAIVNANQGQITVRAVPTRRKKVKA